MSSSAAAPSSRDWYAVLEGAVGDDELKWLVHWARGWPVLADEPRRAGLWRNLFLYDLPWTEELLVSLAKGDGPPDEGCALLLLQHPRAALEVHRTLGYSSTMYNSEWTRVGRVALNALDRDPDPRSKVAAYLARSHESYDLLSASQRAYDERFDLLLNPSHGGGGPRLETFLQLRLEWTQGGAALVEAVRELVP